MHEILIISDTHCHFEVLQKIIEREIARNPDIDTVLHCGDFGAYDCDALYRVPKREQYLIKKHNNPIHMFKPYLRKTDRFLLQVYAIPGNHEDFELVDMLVSGAESIANLHFLGQGDIACIRLGKRELRIMGLGKILPQGISEKNRTRSKIIKESDISKAVANGSEIDILMLHEPPLITFEHGGSVGNWEISEMVHKIEPQLIFAGHIHHEYNAQVRNSALYGLGYGVKGRYALLDEKMRLSFRSLCGKKITPRSAVAVENPDFPKPVSKKRKKTRKAHSFPITAGEILEIFTLPADRKHKKLLRDYFYDLKTKHTPDINRKDALELAEKFLQEKGLIVSQ